MAEEYKTFRSEQKEIKMRKSYCEKCKQCKSCRSKDNKRKLYDGDFDTFGEFMDDCLRRSRERMEKESTIHFIFGPRKYNS